MLYGQQCMKYGARFGAKAATRGALSYRAFPCRIRCAKTLTLQRGGKLCSFSDVDALFLSLWRSVHLYYNRQPGVFKDQFRTAHVCTYGERGARERITGVWGRSPQHGSRGQSPRWGKAAF